MIIGNTLSNKIMKRIILADVKSYNRNGKSTGHYFSVADNYLDIFKNRCDVIVAGGPLYKKKYSKLLQLPFDTTPQGFGLFNKLRIIINTLYLFSKLDKNDILVLQSNAVATTFFSLALYRGKRPIYMIQYNKMGIDTKFKRFLFKLAKAKINGVICPDPLIGMAYCKNYCVVPDYIMTENQLKKLYEREIPKEYDFGILGIITEDKGVVEAASWAAKTGYRVLIAGRPADEQIRKQMLLLTKNKKNIKLILDYLDDKDYDRYLRQIKYCILNYSDAYSEHSSGVIFDALYRGTPIIGRRCKFLELIEDNEVGVLYDDISECNFEQLIDINTINKFKANLKIYLEKQIQCVDKLDKFLR